MPPDPERRPTRLQGLLAAKVQTAPDRRRLVASVSVVSALISVALCAIAYWATGVRPHAPVEIGVAYGLPVLIPLLVTPFIFGHLVALAAQLHDRSKQLEDEVRRRRRAEAKLAVLVTTDDLTQLPNRRAFFARAAEIANGTGEACMVAIVDLDNFKRLNDTRGHAAGDEALRATGELLRGHLDQHGVVARLGGEEFGMILPGMSADDAQVVLDGLRGAFGSFGDGITVSIGGSEWGPGESIDAALGRADSALYRAKQRGRNRVELASAFDGDFGTELSPVARRESPTSG